jgi:hypothetical protein
MIAIERLAKGDAMTLVAIAHKKFTGAIAADRQWAEARLGTRSRRD